MLMPRLATLPNRGDSVSPGRHGCQRGAPLRQPPRLTASAEGLVIRRVTMDPAVAPPGSGNGPLLDDVGRPLKDRGRQRQLDGLCRLAVDDQLELGGVVDGRVGEAWGL